MNFTFDEYADIINLLRDNDYIITNYHDKSSDISKKVILRHDVDLSLDKAFEFACFENNLGVKSTYYILITSELYNLVNVSSIKKVKQMSEMGHDIGLHFDESQYNFDENKDWTKQITEAIINERAIMETILNDVSIKSVSMHIPSNKTIKSNLTINGMVNSYSDEYFSKWKYLSDSNMHWREDVKSIIKSKKYSRLHILTHPFWYEKNINSKNNKITYFIDKKIYSIYELMKIIVPDMNSLK